MVAEVYGNHRYREKTRLVITTAHWRAVVRKEEGSDSAEPSLEGPVGQTTGNRPLYITSSRLIVRAFQNAGPWFSGLGRVLRVQNFLLLLAKNSATSRGWVANFPWVVAGSNPGLGIS